MSAETPLEALLQRVRDIGAAIPDGWLVVDAESRVRAFNAPYRALFPRAQARRLDGSRCCELLALGVCERDGCLARRCQREGATLRFDEIEGRVEGEAARLRFIVTAAPLRLDDAPEGDAAASLLVLRDVSDTADVQRKYKEMLEQQTREKEQLRAEILSKTRELREANIELNRIQKELMRFKKGLFGA